MPLLKVSTIAPAATVACASGHHVSLVDSDSPGLVVKSAVARRQMDAESAKSPVSSSSTGQVTGGEGTEGAIPSAESAVTPIFVATQPKRFHGAVTLNTARVGRDASRIADEVIAHLSSLVSARVTVTLEIEATIPEGASDQVVRTVTENARTLKFTTQGFENE